MDVHDRTLLGVAAALAVATGLIHLFIAATGQAGGAEPAFWGIGLVYLVGVGLILAGVRRELFLEIGLYWVVVLLLAWAGGAVSGSPVSLSTLGFVDKAIEAVLLVVLLVMRRRGLMETPEPAS